MFQKIKFINNLKSSLLKADLNLKPIFSLFIFIILLSLSWFYLSDLKINSEEELTHSLLQSKFQEVLSEFVKKNHSEINNISFNRVWTKKTKDPSQVEIYFNYSLNLEDGENELEGSALLYLSQEKIWQITNFQVEKTSLEFSKAIVIKAELENSEETDN